MAVSSIQFWVASKVIEWQTPAPTPPGTPVPLAPVCESVALACLTDEENTMYIENGTIRFEGNIDENRIKDALQGLMDRHDSLRMRFSLDDDGHVQGHITGPGIMNPRLEVRKMKSSSEEDVGFALRDLDVRPLDVRDPPLMRTTLLYLANDVVLMHIGLSHAVIDGTSLPQFLKELSILYNGKTIKPVPYQYSQFCGWQRNLITGTGSTRVKSQLSFWESKLQGAPPLLELPTDKPRPPIFNHRGAEYNMVIDGDTITQMQRVMKENRQSPWRLMLACYYWMLRTFSGQEDVVITMPRTTRLPTMLETIGHFANFVPIRLQMSEEWNLVDTCRHIGQVIKAAAANGDVPFSSVIERCCANRNSAYAPIAQVSISLILDEWQVCPDVDGAKSSFGKACTTHRCLNDLHVKVFMKREEIEFGFLYNCEVFEEHTIARMAQTMKSISRMWFSNEASTYASLDVFPSENGSLNDISSCLGTLCPSVLQGPLAHEIFEQQAEKNPDNVCIVFGEQSLTYRDVNRKANMLASHLAETAKVGPEVLVGIMLDRNPELVVSILAVLKAGGAYVPMDPNYPDDRLSIYATESGCSLVLTQTSHLKRAEQVANGNSYLIVEDIVAHAEKDETYDLNRVTSNVTNESTCLVLFTSGSTGKPKGVQHAHRHLQDLILGTIKYHNLCQEDVILMTNSICFDVHLLQLFCPLLSGARLILAKANGQVDGEYIGSMIVKHKVTGLIFTVPFLASEYLKSTAMQEPYPYMKHWGMGGDAVTLEIVHAMQERFPNIRGPINSYGPTEGNVVTQYKFPRNSLTNPIGVPDDNMHCCVVDKCSRVVPKGVRGELLLSGPRMFKGYFGKKDLTDEKCIPNPAFDMIKNQLPEEMLQYYKTAYKTGDLVRLRKDANRNSVEEDDTLCSDFVLEYLGRIDRQVKISGVRIELGEVETALRAAPGVTEAVATVKLDQSGTKRLVGYILPGTVDTSEVLSHVRTVLMASMVPSFVYALQEFTLLPNGKVDVKSLPEITADTEYQEYEEPETEMESLVCELWKQILGLDGDVSVTADIYSLGAASIHILKFVAQLRKSVKNMPENVSLTSFFDNPSPRQQADLIEGLIGLKQDDQPATKRPMVRSTTFKQPGSKAPVLSAESLNVCDYVKSPVPENDLSFPLYMALQLGLCCLVASTVPLASILTLLVGYWISLSMGSLFSLLCIFILPPIFLSLLAFCLILSKSLLFPNKMPPGVYPLFGSVYLRWSASNAMSRSILPILHIFIGRSPIMLWLLRSLGAQIGENVILDTWKITEPDLITIGDNVVFGHETAIGGAFVAPKGFLDEQAGCLVLSKTVVESDCLVGDYATVMAGGLLESGQSLKPFGTLSREDAVTDDSIDETFPHFYPEMHLSIMQQILSTIQALTFYCLSVSPVVGIFAYTVILYWNDYLAFGDGMWPYLKNHPMMMFFLCAGLLYGTSLLQYFSTKGIIWYKNVCVGKFTQGSNVIKTGKVFAYNTYKRLLSFPNVQLSAVAKSQGLECPGIANYVLSDFEMVKVGKGGNTNGNVHFRCLDKNGTFHMTEIKNRVSTGNCVFFPGCQINEDCLVGNESSVSMGTQMDAGYQIQGSNIIKWPQGLKQKSGLADKTVPPSKAQVMQILRPRMYFWGPVEFAWVNGISLMIGYQGLRSGIIVLIALMPIIMFFRMTCALLWMRFRRWSVGYSKMVQAGQSQTGENILEFALFRMCNILTLSTTLRLHILYGTPWYSLAAKLVGMDVKVRAIMNSPLMPEFHLMHVGECVMEIGAIVTTHFVSKGHFCFERVVIEDFSWVQAFARILVPVKVAAGSRVLPRTTIMPREFISKGQVWSGVPGMPAGKVRPANVRRRVKDRRLVRRVSAIKVAIDEQGKDI